MFSHMRNRALVVALALGIEFWLGAGRARAQGPTIDSTLPSTPGGGASSLGAAPGTGASVLGTTPGGGASLLNNGPGGGPISGRPGATGTRVLQSAVNPPTVDNNTPQAYSAPAEAPTYTAPSYGAYAIPTGPEDDGPADGLTLDQAIDRLVKENLDLRGKSYEIPQAEADILNAGLRANPVFYADGQLIPYGRYTKDRPGGQTQYDVNVSYPLDVSRKRAARSLYATRAKRVIEAQYQDAVRTQIDQLYTLYLNVLSARQTVRYSESAVKGLTDLYTVTLDLFKKEQNTRADVLRVKGQLEEAEVGLIDSREGLKKAKRDLAAILNIPADQSDSIEVRGTIKDLAPAPPPEPELIQMALALRPDVVSFRLGIKTAEANVRLQLANRFTDLYVLYQPYTLQDNTPFGLKSPTSWALGITAPLPVYNRNQGAIARAKLNVTQSRVELANLERQVVNDVQQALHEYEVTAKMVKRINKELLPAAAEVRDTTKRLYLGGEVNVVAFLNAQRDYVDIVKRYLDTVVRHRRSMLALNTVLAQRVFP